MSRLSVEYVQGKVLYVVIDKVLLVLSQLSWGNLIPISATIELIRSGETRQGSNTAKLIMVAEEGQPKKTGKLDKLKDKLTSNKKNDETSAIESIVKNNHSVDQESINGKSLEDLMKRLATGELLTGLAPTGKNNKDMADYKFWSTQPVSKFDDQVTEEGPIEPEGEAPTKPIALLGDFEWVTMDLDDPAELKEVYELLSLNYVEDGEAAFRFDYSASFLHWALQSPGFKKEWHIGVRVKASKRLVAFISGIPMTLRARKQDILCAEINFLCVHKKLRSKRLAPTLIKEVTRRVHVDGIWQALYTAGVVLPKPFTSCRYFHRTLDWTKLNEIGFTSLPPRSTKARQLTKFKLPATPKIKGLRAMTADDVPKVADLLRRTLERFDVYQVFSDEEVAHWFVSDEKLPSGERVIWTYVVEADSKITDFFSFYSLPSSITKSSKYSKLNAAYLFYYGSESAFTESRDVYEARLQELINDALILAKALNFDVFNALSLLDNPSFLEPLKFGPGDGYLNFYLYNYKIMPVDGGLQPDGSLNSHTSGVGMVML